ncbi:hypothetical protein BCR42DRAFT_410735 [Absidia repens]|uniref:Protein prenylyltransferase n=1 Tax=Absidia repens TaxID=90262 RepID=A0A1X2IPE1_9FUNG|nr:hypothetical protein BCR42DRAFT_410735 [Absidia repens]
MSLYNKIIHALTHYSINELGILPCTPSVDDVPPSSQKYHPLLVVECKLGISFDDLGQALKETQEKIKEHRQQPLAEAVWEQITRVMVLLKPEHYTAMNARKQLLVSGQVNIEDELKLNQLIFTIPRNTKSSIAWYHREWLFTHDNHGTMNLENEMELCQRAITLYPRNYYAWNYRHYLLTWMTTTQQQSSDVIARVHVEYQTTCQWLETNISDHTGIRYLEKTLEMWVSAQQQQQQQQEYHVLRQHMAWLDELILRYPGHESLWCHRRYCATLFFHNNITRQSLYQWVQQQHAFIKQLLDNHSGHHQEQQHLSIDDEDNMLQQQLGYAAKFGLWLCFLETKQEQQNEINPSHPLVDFYVGHVQQLDGAPIYLQYLKQLWQSSKSLQGQISHDASLS